ncbi:MAG: zinc-ribbon domain-containing protein [Thaumarchaeota archaeon]|jgi:DNA-directed RNA polymerase subunit RPC12/RpoP/archaellum component FlaC|nr:zinc-ribbon domain-containing protein [Candidatus Geocrenenecus arthurdayi]
MTSCPRCGRKVSEEDTYCPYCGHRLSEKVKRKNSFRGYFAATIVLAIALAVTLIISSFAYAGLQTRLIGLEADYRSLNSRYDSLVRDYDRLSSSYKELERNYDSLKSTYEKTLSDYRDLAEDYESISNAYKSLYEDFRKLQDRYGRLEKDYSSLKINYSTLEESYRELQAEYGRIAENYLKWRSYLLSYILLNDSIPRVLNVDEIAKLTPIVRSIVTESRDYWRSIWELYIFVTNNIKYAYDDPIPWPPELYEFANNMYQNITIENIILSPSETLELKQGDCEDQAILLYALIRSYQRFIYEKEYILWFIAIDFYNGERHLAIAYPVKTGISIKLTIIDPAGHYYTGSPGPLSSSNPYDELSRYSSWWSPMGGISKITIYDVSDGKIFKLISGGIYDVAQYITETRYK